jgi:TonB-linked SusC/RagA family outer membrane protein
MKKFNLTLLLCVLVIGAYAQTLTGKITEQDTHKPLANITISLPKLNKSTLSDQLGNFKLEVPKGEQLLQITGMGYVTQSKTITIPSTGILEITLVPIVNELEEVTVNTGYQKIAKERATGSFSLVDKQTFNQQIGTDVLSRLEGITPTLSIDRRTASTPILMLRGLSTIRGDRTPLIILDDFPYAGDLANINPNDVENITILKDAAAASIWGAKAGNGVIVISTKKGSYNKKLQVEVNTSTSLISQPTLNEYNNLTAADEIAVEQLLFGKGYYTSQENSSSKISLSPAVELMIAARTGKISTTELAAQLSALGNQDIRQNYANSFFEQAVNSQTSLSLRGGSAKMNWYIFTGYDQNKSALGATFNRLNLKVDNTIRLTEKLDLSISLYLTKTSDESGRISLSSMTTTNGQLPPYTQFVDENGNPLPVMKDYRTSFTSTLAGGNLLDWNYYPLTDGAAMPSTNSKWDMLSNLRLGYTLFKGLKLGLNYQYEKQNTTSRTAYSTESYYVRNLVNRFTQINGTTLTQAIPYGGINSDGQGMVTANNLRGQVNYEGRFGDVSLNALAGGELRDAQTDTKSATTYGVDSENLKTVAVDYVNPYKNSVTGANSYIPYGNGYSGMVSRYISTFANAALNYKGKYTLSGSARRDASNVFGVATNDLWNPLWSVGGAWLLSEEKILKTRYLPYARLRLTYGSSGNSDGKRAAVTTIVYNGTSPYTRTPYANFSNYANPDLKWETVHTFNLGADFKWFNNRLALSVDYYVKKSDDLIENAAIDYTGGIGFQINKNAAKISARGLDIELNSMNTKGQLKWTTSLFANYYTDRMDAYYLSSQAASTFVNGSFIVSGIVDKPVYSIYAYKWAGLNPINGNPRSYVNGAISEDYATITGAKTTLADLAYIGRAFPTLTGAMGNSFKWKNLSLDFRVSYKLGYYFRRASLDYGALYAQRRGNSEYTQRWQKQGDELITNVPSAIYPALSSRDNFYTYSEATIISGDHIRLQYVGLGYVLSKDKFTKLPFQNITLRAVANNLGLLWKRHDAGVDPDYPGAIPSKIYSFNLQFNL